MVSGRDIRDYYRFRQLLRANPPAQHRTYVIEPAELLHVDLALIVVAHVHADLQHVVLVTLKQELPDSFPDDR